MPKIMSVGPTAVQRGNKRGNYFSKTPQQHAFQTNKNPKKLFSFKGLIFGCGGRICSSSYHLPNRLIDHPNWLRGLDATFTELTINGEENRTKTEDLVLRSEGRGHKFESCRVHQYFQWVRCIDWRWYLGM